MTHRLAEEPPFDLSAGALCLDFANTLEDRFEPEPNETLHDYSDLLRFAVQAGVLDRELASQLLDEADHHPAEVDAVMSQAKAFREAIYRVMSPIAGGDISPQEDLKLVNRVVGEALSHSRIVPTDDGYEWGWESDQTALDRPIWYVARSLLDVMTGDELGRLRECAAHDCGWLFIDRSRNKSRRWCDMSSCGNRAKVNRFRERERATR